MCPYAAFDALVDDEEAKMQDHQQEIPNELAKAIAALREQTSAFRRTSRRVRQKLNRLVQASGNPLPTELAPLPSLPYTNPSA